MTNKNVTKIGISYHSIISYYTPTDKTCLKDNKKGTNNLFKVNNKDT